MSHDNMIYIIRNISRVLYTVGVFLSACCAMGCSHCEEELQTVEYAGKNVALQFCVDSKVLQSSSRADEWSDSEGHTEEESSDFFENVINFSDFRFMIFHFFENNGTRDSRLVFDSSCPKYGENIYYSYNHSLGPNGSYIINAAIPMVKGQFEIESDGHYTDLRIVVFANTNGAQIPEFSLYSTSWSAMLEKAKDAIYTVSDWYPNGTDCFIPMYGWNDYNIDNSLLYKSEIYDPVIQEEPVALLRAVAKIEIIDNIQRNNGSIYPKITDVQGMTGATSENAFQINGYLMPTNYVPMRQVSSPSVPTDNGIVQRGGIKFEEYTDINPGINTVSPVNYWRAYCPEQVFSVTGATGTTRPTVPIINVKVNTSGTSSEVYKINLDGNVTDYGKKFDGFNAILRNHIYRIEILAVEKNQTITLKYEVAAFDEYTSGKIQFGPQQQ